MCIIIANSIAVKLLIEELDKWNEVIFSMYFVCWKMQRAFLWGYIKLINLCYSLNIIKNKTNEVYLAKTDSSSLHEQLEGSLKVSSEKGK